MNIDASLISLTALMQRAAAAATGHQRVDAGALYVVATPIGNLADITLRAIHVLGFVDAVAAEDTRVAGSLLAHLGLKKPLIALHAHNEAAAARAVCERLAAGDTIAYVSDAGTPAVSDPGAALVAAAVAAGHRVVPLPGASAALAALSVAGDALAAAQGRGFRFAGFVPAKGAERRVALAALAAEPMSVLLFEAPHRIEALAAELAALMPTRRVTLARELTKQFESIVTDAAAALPAWLAGDANRARGEFVLVLHALPLASPAADELPTEALRVLDVLLAELPLKQAAALAATITGTPRKALYREALARRGPGGSEED